MEQRSPRVRSEVLTVKVINAFKAIGGLAF